MHHTIHHNEADADHYSLKYCNIVHHTLGRWPTGRGLILFYDFVTTAHLLHSSSPLALCFQHRAHLLLLDLESVIRTFPNVADMSVLESMADSPRATSLSAKAAVVSSPRLTVEIPNMEGRSSSGTLAS